MVNPIPEGFNTVSAHLVVRGAKEAIAFYEKAFGAKAETCMEAPGGGVMHASLRIGDSTVMLADEMPMMEYWVSPAKLGGTTVGISICVEDADALFKQAVDAGCEITFDIHDAFWGDRYGKVRDPFGHEWEISTHIHDYTPEEIAENAKAFFANMGC